MEGTRTRVLVVDDDTVLRKLLAGLFTPPRFDMAAAPDGTAALSRLEKEEFDVVLLDLNMPGINGIAVLRHLKETGSTAEVVVFTGYPTVPTAVDAMKLGAYDFLSKPVKLEELAAVVEKAAEKKRLVVENQRLKVRLSREAPPADIATRSPSMLLLLETARTAASSGLPVLVTGETGVGKELVARYIHRESPRGEGPLVPLNCGAFPEQMLENELFGHERGAFTGAVDRKPGLLEVADGGTLFLDELCEMALPLQSKLLRVLETGRFFRLGGLREIAVDVRLISATNRDVEREMAKGRLRADLFYRISTLRVEIPPLRARREDIPLLIAHWAGNDPDFQGKEFTPEALEALAAYRWPGNVRELRSVVQRTFLLSRSSAKIGREEVAGCLGPSLTATGRRLADVERAHILRVLRETGGRRADAAKILGIDPKTLYRKLRSYGEQLD